MFVFCNIKNKVGLDNTTQYLFNFTFYVLFFFIKNNKKFF